MLKAIDIERNFASQRLFRRVSWFVADRDRIGLVGPNGSGKSTWLKMLAEEESPDAGRYEKPKGYRVGYLPQFSFRLGQGTVRSEAKDAFNEILQMQEEQTALEAKLSDEENPPSPEEAETLLARHHRLEESFRIRGGYEIDRRVDRVLRGLGFALEDFERPVEELSGGWQMRVALARILLEQPDLLLLDEPTNHLDLEAREWLAEFLRSYPGSFVLVSHDRHFLDQTITRTSEIMSNEIIDYSGNYSFYEKERVRRYDAALKAWERQQDEIQRIERFIERFKAKNTKATQAQSRVKMLEKMERLEKPLAPVKGVHFKFPPPDRSDRRVLSVVDVDKAYGPVRVFDGVSLEIERGQKVALVGPNGAGKSTLMRLLAGHDVPDAGSVDTGGKVVPEYFAQDAADKLPRDRTILQVAEESAPTSFVPQVRGLLGAFLFSGAAVDKPIGVLSGGERNRLALALMLMTPSNLFLLDEPTNHLDMNAKDVLLGALKDFEGTVVFVSHDRHFLTSLADRVVEVGGGGVYDYPGDFESFLKHKEERALREGTAGDGKKRGGTTGNVAENGAAGGAANRGANGAGNRVANRVANRAAPGAGVTSGEVDGAASGESGRSGDQAGVGAAGAANGSFSSGAAAGAKSSKKRSGNARKVAKLEERIAELEGKKEKLEALLAGGDVYQDAEKASFYTSEYQQISGDLDAAMEEWAELAD